MSGNNRKTVLGDVAALLASIGASVAEPTASAPADDSPSKAIQAGGDGKKTCFLLAPKPNQVKPEKGYGLLLILPGGHGSAAFRPFVSNIYAQAVPGDFLAAQLVAPKWSDDQQIVWPTRANKVQGQQFSTEEFIESVVTAIAKDYPLDHRRIFTLSWSSGGPAAYAASLAEGTRITGSFVAMSVFKPQTLDLKRARGRAYYLYHSPEDRVCPFWMARQAAQMLTKQGARAKLAEYPGGHGWRGDVFAEIRAGLEWLASNAEKAGSPASQPVTNRATK